MPIRRTLLAACLAALPVVASAPAATTPPATPKPLSCPSVATTAPVKQDKAVRAGRPARARVPVPRLAEVDGRAPVLRLPRPGGHRRGVRGRASTTATTSRPKDVDADGQGAADGCHRGRPRRPASRSRARRGRATTSGRRTAHAASSSSYASELVALQQQNGSIPDDDARLPRDRRHDAHDLPGDADLAAGASRAPPTTSGCRRSARPSATSRASPRSGTQDRRLPPEHQLRAARPRRPPASAPPRRARCALQQLLLVAAEPGRRAGASSARRATRSPPGRRSTRSSSPATPTRTRSSRAATRWLVEHQDADGVVAHGAQRAGRRREGRRHVGGARPRHRGRDERRGAAALVDGQHVADTMTLEVEARDNRGAAAWARSSSSSTTCRSTARARAKLS